MIKLSLVSRKVKLAAWLIKLRASSGSVTPANCTRMRSSPSTTILGSVTPNTSIRFSIVLYVLFIISDVTFLPSMLSTLYKTSNPPCKSRPKFKFCISGTNAQPTTIATTNTPNNGFTIDFFCFFFVFSFAFIKLLLLIYLSFYML